MPLWILFFTALTLALHSVPAEAPEPEPSAPVEVVLTEPVFRAETGLPLYPDYTLDKDLLVWAEEYEASTGTPVVMYDLRTSRPPAIRGEAIAPLGGTSPTRPSATQRIPRLPESPVKAGDLLFYKSAGVTGADGGASRPAGKWRYR